MHALQMGSNMKRTIFEEQMVKALRDWLKETKERQRLKKVGAVGGGSVDASSGDNRPSYGTSPLHMGQKYSANRTDLKTHPNISPIPQSNCSLSDSEI